MKAATEAEDASDMHPVTPRNIIPARVLLGELLMALDHPDDALMELEVQCKAILTASGLLTVLPALLKL